MNHFFLPSLIPLTKGNTGLRVFKNKRKTSFCHVKRNVKTAHLGHTYWRFLDFTRNDRMLFYPKNS